MTILWPILVYPLAGIGAMALYWHSSHPLASEGSGDPVYWGKKLGSS